jgi:hypothetical protein
MFTGQKGCFCCSDPPDPPPPCEVCEACAGEQTGDCANKVCPSFVIEVEGFANTTTQQNCSGYVATGTACGAYNGTFVLEKVSDCLYRSDSFTATVPITTEINGIQCHECENVEVFYQLFFYQVPSPFFRDVELTIHRVSDGEVWFAKFHGKYMEQLPTTFFFSMCNEEALEAEQTEQLGAWPPRLVTYQAAANTEGNLFGQASTYGRIRYNTSPFVGATRPDGSRQYDPYSIDECGGVKTTFDNFPKTVLSPKWVCCKDELFDCDLVRDEISTGMRDTQVIPVLRIVDIRCGT